MAMAGLGAVAGSQKDVSTTGVSNYTDSTANAGLGQNVQSQYNNILSGYNDGNGGEAGFGNLQSNAASSGQNYFNMLGNYAASGGLPSQGDIDTSNNFASSMFAPQRTQMQQAYTQAGYDTQRMSAVMGRGTNDPVLQAKLQTGYMNNQAQLGAQQGAFASQYAMNLPKQRLGYAGAQATYGDQLASQAFKNRAALMSMGSDIYNMNRNFGAKLAGTATTSGGGMKGAMAGWMTGVANDMSSMKNIMSMYGGGGGMGGGGYQQPQALEAPAPSSSQQSYGSNQPGWGYGPSSNGSEYGALIGGGY